jgi:hypothetical protein
MKFKILKGTVLFEKFIALINEINRCDDAALALMKELGGIHIRGEHGNLGGGIGSIKMPEKPKDWGNSYVDGEYMPIKNRKANKEVLEKLAALPIVKDHALNSLINYNWKDHEGRRLNFTPEVNWRKDHILIAIGEQYPRYKAVEDMVEITTTEFNTLKAGE